MNKQIYCNDNNINPVWIDFKNNEPEVFRILNEDSRFKNLLHKCKFCRRKTLEQSASHAFNFIWFMKWEYTMVNQPPDLTVVK